MDSAAHIELWIAIATIAASAGVAIFRLGWTVRGVLLWLSNLHENQRALATKAGVELPYPPPKQ